MIVLENRSYDEVLGNANMPWLNSAMKRYAVATNYRSIAEPSQPNYFALTAGTTGGVTTNDAVTLDVPSIASQLTESGGSWRAYMQGLRGKKGLYVRKHDPFTSYGQRVVPFTGFAADMREGDVPQFLWITPDVCRDMHGDEKLCADRAALDRAGDRFTRDAVAAIQRSPGWSDDSAIFITFDEGDEATNGNHVLTLVIGPGGKRRSARAYDHYSLLRTIEDGLGLPCLENACSARPLNDLLVP